MDLENGLGEFLGHQDLLKEVIGVAKIISVQSASLQLINFLVSLNQGESGNPY